MTSLKGIIIILLSAILFQACSSTDEKDTSSNEAEEQKADSSIIVLKPESVSLAEIKTEPAGHRLIHSVLEVPGTIKADENRLTHVGSRIAGRVIDVSASLGDRVGRGQKLAIIDSLELGKTQSEYIAARAKLEVAEKAYQRAKTLLDGKVIGAGEFQRREGEYLSAKADAQASEDQLHLLGMSEREVRSLAGESSLNSRVAITSPLAGIVIQRHITMGEVVEPAKDLFTIADLSAVWGIADVPEQDASRVRKGLPAEVVVSAYPQERFTGTVTYVSDTLDPDSRTIKVRVEVDNSAGKLKPEMFAGFRIIEEHQQNALAVPDSAIQREGAETFVYLARNGGFEKRIVALGRKFDGSHEVLSGLTAGEKIVTRGAFILKSESLKDQMEEE